jgi:phage gp36-like protein
MKFIVESDWEMQIRTAVLNAVQSNSNALSDAIDTAISEASSYLRGKYDVAKIFAAVYTYDPAISYPLNTRILLTAAPFSASISYSEDTLVVFNNKVYQAKTALPAGAWNINNWNYVAENNTHYSVKVPNSTAGYLPTSQEYTAGDTRDAILLTYTKDIALYHAHSPIASQNVPANRQKRYDDAIKWLDKVSKDMLNPNLPLLDEEATSGAFRLGGKDKYSARW